MNAGAAISDKGGGVMIDRDGSLIPGSTPGNFGLQCRKEA